MTQWEMECVDGCPETVTITGSWTEQRFYVRHGENREHVRAYTFAELFVTSGFAPWVRRLHDREAEMALLYGVNL